VTRRTPKRAAAGGKASHKPAAERIRESAQELFYLEGIRAVGVDRIVTRAGVTKPSLYRSFPSKDELAAGYLRDHGDDYLRRFDAAIAEKPDNPRGQLRLWLSALSEKAAKADYRGCGVTNAAVEYPERDHPARKAAMENKRKFRARLKKLCDAMGAGNGSALADALLLLIEGAYMSGQLFARGGPARVIVEAADMLVDAHLRAAQKASSGRGT
jgi:AcrR family transcriptional regulator